MSDSNCLEYFGWAGMITVIFMLLWSLSLPINNLLIIFSIQLLLFYGASWVASQKVTGKAGLLMIYQKKRSVFF